MKSYIAVDDLNRSKFHPLPYTHITPADIKDAEAYKRGWNDAIDAIIENTPPAYVVDKERYDRLLENSIIISEALNRYQTADVVKVVRCKDCKHLVRNEGVCKVLSNNYEPPVYVYDDDFCSRGKRRDDE